jgi:phage N-6-adenine-methyltransferase
MEKSDMKTLFSSNRGDWETPKDFFDWVSDIMGVFYCDVAATKINKICEYYRSFGDNDGLVKDWMDTNWCNPPYGRKIGQWTSRASEQAKIGNKSVLLVPARTDTKWFQRAAKDSEDAFFLKGRLKFAINGIEQDAAPFPSALLFFGWPLTKEQKKRFSERGFVY